MRTIWPVLVLVGACNSPNAAAPDAPKPHDAPAIDAPAPATVSGMLGGAPFGASDAVSNTTTANGFDFPGMSTDVTLTTFAHECALQSSQTGTPNGRVLLLILGIPDGAGGSAPATSTGAYTIFSGTPAASSQLAEAYFEADDATCRKASSAMATGGVVTLDSATSPVSGTFDLTFDTGEHVTGSFAAPLCTALDPNSTPLGGC
jgi:hypothetical protein